MPRALRVCSVPGCPNLCSGGRCDQCRAQAERDRAGHKLRGGGNDARWRARRHQCLVRDPLCVCADDGHGHDGRECIRPSAVADHSPRTKRELIDQGVRDPDALEFLQGKCKSCHDRISARDSPGGFRIQ